MHGANDSQTKYVKSMTKDSDQNSIKVSSHQYFDGLLSETIH